MYSVFCLIYTHRWFLIQKLNSDTQLGMIWIAFVIFKCRNCRRKSYLCYRFMLSCIMIKIDFEPLCIPATALNCGLRVNILHCLGSSRINVQHSTAAPWTINTSKRGLDDKAILVKPRCLANWIRKLEALTVTGSRSGAESTEKCQNSWRRPWE